MGNTRGVGACVYTIIMCGRTMGALCNRLNHTTRSLRINLPWHLHAVCCTVDQQQQCKACPGMDPTACVLPLLLPCRVGLSSQKQVKQALAVVLRMMVVDEDVGASRQLLGYTIQPRVRVDDLPIFNSHLECAHHHHNLLHIVYLWQVLKPTQYALDCFQLLFFTSCSKLIMALQLKARTYIALQAPIHRRNRYLFSLS